ncbi:hypothetical protein CY34DRAFT_90305 [Suillus luteus UH-Slu-Lm8-n1]|uniref:Endonuclease/exonuclease/phosphatase domain-containing protein n=1 Tax=Suillus luteus UH-Slu-Lm8-n1 TaxID=930992 RepID=A0A0D0AWT6_9AGAM|nr:hypothetical protein CY34DRAFT_90305 [Suillus luteus UH-Slu-Lm8-n1]
MWKLTSNTYLFTVDNLNSAGTLINLLALYNLIQVLPAGIATLKASNTKNQTRPDNIFCSEVLENTFTQCKVKYHLYPINTNHYPIISTLDLQPDRTNLTPCLNYREEDWDLVNKALAMRLDSINQPAELTNKEQFQVAMSALMRAITDTVEEQLSKTKPSPSSKCCKKARDKLPQQNHPIHEEYWITYNKFSERIKKSKDSHWNEWLESLTETGI